MTFPPGTPRQPLASLCGRPNGCPIRWTTRWSATGTVTAGPSTPPCAVPPPPRPPKCARLSNHLRHRRPRPCARMWPAHSNGSAAAGRVDEGGQPPRRLPRCREQVLALTGAQGEGQGVLACTNHRVLFLFVGLVRKQFLQVSWNQAKAVVYTRSTKSLRRLHHEADQTCDPAMAVRSTTSRTHKPWPRPRRSHPPHPDSTSSESAPFLEAGEAGLTGGRGSTPGRYSPAGRSPFPG